MIRADWRRNQSCVYCLCIGGVGLDRWFIVEYSCWLNFIFMVNSITLQSMQNFILILTVVLSHWLFLSKLFQLATAGSNAAFIALILRSFDSSWRELSNGGLRIKFGAVEVKFCWRSFWRRRQANSRLQTSLVGPFVRSRLEQHFGPLFKPIEPLEAEIRPLFGLIWLLAVCIVVGRWSL